MPGRISRQRGWMMPNASTTFRIFLLVLLFPFSLVAQHGTHGSASGAGTAPAGSAGVPADNPDLSDFKRAIQLQANPFQVAQYQTASKDTAEALKLARDFAHRASGADKLADVQGYANALNDAVDDAKKSNTEFVKMMNDNQTSGLKKLVKQLNKAEAAVGKQQKALTQEIDRSNPDPKRVAVEADSLDKSLTQFRSSQINLAHEMGIQTS
jgi:hypothetical protein